MSIHEFAHRALWFVLVPKNFGFSVFRFCCSFRFANFTQFSIWLSVFFKKTNGFFGIFSTQPWKWLHGVFGRKNSQVLTTIDMIRSEIRSEIRSDPVRDPIRSDTDFVNADVRRGWRGWEGTRNKIQSGSATNGRKASQLCKIFKGNENLLYVICTQIL